MLHNLKRNGAASSELKTKVRKIAASKMSEIFSSPVKSHSDKKEYRLIKLPNGLTSLLIQHFIEDDPTEEDSQHVDKKISESDVSEISSKDSEVSGSEDGEEGDEEGDDSTKEKMAAVALCIRVGSFFDPERIQGLSHFLEHMVRRSSISSSSFLSINI